MERNIREIVGMNKGGYIFTNAYTHKHISIEYCYLTICTNMKADFTYSTESHRKPPLSFK